MTDKQIIIDSVDVSGCKYFENTENEMCCSLHCCGGCRTYKDCYFKQLKRKEQECEFLKNCLDKSFKMQTDSELWWEKERKDLKTKCDQLKAERNKIKKLPNFDKEIFKEITGIEVE